MVPTLAAVLFFTPAFVVFGLNTVLLLASLAFVAADLAGWTVPALPTLPEDAVTAEEGTRAEFATGFLATAVDLLVLDPLLLVITVEPEVML